MHINNWWVKEADVIEVDGEKFVRLSAVEALIEKVEEALY